MYEHNQIKAIDAGTLTIFEVLNLPKELKKHHQRVFTAAPFREDEKKYIVQGLLHSRSITPSSKQPAKGSFVLVVPEEDNSITPVNVCVGCLHNQIVKNTGNHPENASDEDMAKALVEVAQRYINDPNRNSGNHDHLE